MRVAIVGFGPKGLFALERLLDHASTLDPCATIVVDLFEPHSAPGAGPNYDPTQPSYLRMNFAAGLVDLWWPTSRAVPRSERLSFVDWTASVGMPLASDTYVPRALVGRYLTSGLETMLRHAPRWVDVRLRPSEVERVSRRGSEWDVIVAGASAGVYDEVLLATGHLQGSPYPIGRWLSPEQVSAGQVVAVRGFALTFIDVALALTEGRGGSFSRRDHPFRLRYVTPVAPVGAILPFSRTGRPMLAKPHPSVAAPRHELDRIAERARAELAEIEGTVELAADVLPVVARAARASLAAADVFADVEPEAWLAAAASGSTITSGRSAYDELERSLAVGAGLAPPDLPWALGYVWRSLYPATVARLSGDGLREDDWPAFLLLSAELERVAFGPAPINAAKLLALVDAGQVDLTNVAAGEPSADVVVDAVLPGPGVTIGSDTVVARLIADGHARLAPGRRGLDVHADGSCLSGDGSSTRGLAAIGRPTEDAVIGNDTLSRTLHPVSDRWARRIVEQHSLVGVT